MSCAVPGCPSRRRLGRLKVNNEIISLHRFPIDSKVRKGWIKNVKRGPNWRPSQYTKLCSLHFEESCFRDGYKRRYLHSHAVPTIFHKGLRPRPRKPKTRAFKDKQEEAIPELPEVCELIARVYQYLQQEFETLKKVLHGVDLSVLANIVRRTAEATGVSERAMAAILSAYGPRAQGHQDTRPNHVESRSDVRQPLSSTTHASPNITQHRLPVSSLAEFKIETVGEDYTLEKPQQETRDYEIETVKAEIEEEEEEKEEHLEEEERLEEEEEHLEEEEEEIETLKMEIEEDGYELSPAVHQTCSPLAHVEVITAHHMLSISPLAVMRKPACEDNPWSRSAVRQPLSSTTHARPNITQPRLPVSSLAEFKIETVGEDYTLSSISTHHVTPDSSNVMFKSEPPDDNSNFNTSACVVTPDVAYHVQL